MSEWEIAGVVGLVILGLALMIAGLMLLLFSIFDAPVNDNWEEVDVEKPEDNWSCPRGGKADDVAHTAGYLVHRRIEGRLVCMFEEVAMAWDHRNWNPPPSR